MNFNVFFSSFPVFQLFFGGMPIPIFIYNIYYNYLYIN